MFNQAGRQSVTLATFGGLVTEAPSASLSEGSSPLCWDVDFLVGSVFTRPGLTSVYGAGVNSQNFVWVKTFQQPNGQIYTLALDAAGNVWREDATNSPGSLTNVKSVIAGDLAKSATAFSREYICLSQHDIPRQYDGTNFDRVSQEGPGANATFIANTLSNPNLANITSYAIATNVVTFQAVNGFSIGQLLQVVIPGVSYLNGVILSVASATGTQFTANFTHADVSSTTVTGTATPLTSFSIASITQPAAQTIGEQLLWSAAADANGAGTTLTVYYSQTTQDATLVNAFNSGIAVYVYLSGMPSPYPNGTYQVTSIGRSIWSSNHAFYFTVVMPSIQYKKVGPGAPLSGTYQLTQATVVLSTPMPGTQVGNSVTISGATPAAWNNSWTIVQAANSGIYNVTQTSMDASGNATYNFTLQSGSNPVVGDLVTSIGCTNGNGVFNVTNATVATVGAGFFTVAGFQSGAITAAAETGQATGSGKTFLINPGSAYVGVTNASSPIFGNDTSTGSITVAGQTLQVAAGTRQAVVMFLTRNGFLTKPSPPMTFTMSSNTFAIQAKNIPIGPPNVIARWIAFTEAGANGVPGAYFYVIPTPVQSIVNGQPYTYPPTVINDNTTTEAEFSFIDSVLLSSLEIDVTGGDQFNLVELGSSRWNIQYAGRMFYGLEDNKTTNFVNMSFNGGYYSATNPFPLGWTTDATNGAGGSLVASAVFGNSYYIKNATGGTQTTYGMITQPAFQDAYKVPIIQTNTAYSVRVAARIPSGLTTGNLVIDLVTFDNQIGYGPVTGSYTLPFASMGSTVKVFTGTLLTTTLNPVPNTLVLRLYTTSIANNADVEVDRVEIYPTQQPVLNTQLRASYVNNPESFDGVTGNLGVAATNTQSVNGAFVMYDQLYLLKDASMFSTQDSAGSEPSGWSVHEVSNLVGTCGPNAYDVGEEWCVTACRSGLYVFYGRQPIKISQEIFQVWEAINWSAASTVWVRNDIVNRRIYVGVPMATPNQWLPNAPTNANPTNPNVVLMLNYQGLGDVMSLGEGQQMHTTMFGTLMSVDMRRKWTLWQVTSPYADFITRQNGVSRPLFFCNGTATGKIYQLDPNFTPGTVSPDDGVAVNGTYTTYGWVDLAKASAFPMLGFHRKQWAYLQFLAYGAGTMTVKALLNSLTPPQASMTMTLPAVTLQANPFDDYERPLNASGNRVYLQFSTNAATAAFALERVILVGGQAVLPLRGSASQ